MKFAILNIQLSKNDNLYAFDMSNPNDIYVPARGVNDVSLGPTACFISELKSSEVTSDFIAHKEYKVNRIVKDKLTVIQVAIGDTVLKDDTIIYDEPLKQFTPTNPATIEAAMLMHKANAQFKSDL